ncbi:hypothetical protein RR46_03463 [Papilio xuthus]|uniref:Uncharacterized protein n=1 Tax=Papilio xuthus TaxID=66420 RepID=A0A194Q9K5_PAPXU|nr:hypothetical protein RR46_03463 [Papilio xuthus]
MKKLGLPADSCSDEASCDPQPPPRHPPHTPRTHPAPPPTLVFRRTMMIAAKCHLQVVALMSYVRALCLHIQMYEPFAVRGGAAQRTQLDIPSGLQHDDVISSGKRRAASGERVRRRDAIIPNIIRLIYLACRPAPFADRRDAPSALRRPPAIGHVSGASFNPPLNEHDQEQGREVDTVTARESAARDGRALRTDGGRVPAARGRLAGASGRGRRPQAPPLKYPSACRHLTIRQLILSRPHAPP